MIHLLEVHPGLSFKPLAHVSRPASQKTHEAERVNIVPHSQVSVAEDVRSRDVAEASVKWKKGRCVVTGLRRV